MTMEQSITIEKLYEELYDKLKNMSGLVNMYIGKTKDIEKRREQHKEKYGYTEEIAHGDADIIDKGEKYLIKKFQESDLPCSNIGGGGEGGNDADKLYVSFNYDFSQTKNIEELFDDDLNITSYKLIK